MADATRESGIDVIGNVPWGTHFCLFYETQDDLISVLIPYVRMGLENNELCICITSETFTADKFLERLSAAIPDFDRYQVNGQIELIPYTEWYVVDGVFDAERVNGGWMEKLRVARERGFSGVRIAGDTSWLDKGHWNRFMDYERRVNEIIGQHKMVAMCTYVLDGSDARSVLDVIGAHEFMLIRRDGEWKQIEYAGLKQARMALMESEERFRNIFENAAIGIVIADVNRGYTDVNDRFCEITGYSREKLMTMGCSQIVHPDDQAKDIVEVRRLVRGEATSFIRDLRYVHATGRTVWVRVNASITRLNKKGKSQIVGVVEDITKRKLAEEALKESKQQSELYLDLMGHDINNIHHIAMGYLELAKEVQADSSEAEFLDKTVEVLQRSARLIQNVRKLQKLQDGVFPTREVDARKVLADVAGEFSSVPGKAVNLNFNHSGQCLIKANELLHDAFANLVSNAIKHTGDQAEINIDLNELKVNGRHYYKVMVEDDGPGIPDDFKGRIFNRMLKGTPNAKGMGLGLYLVKSLVESIDGKVWVEDRVPHDYTRGARFVVMLPVAGS